VLANVFDEWRRVGQVGSNFQIVNQAAEDTAIEAEKFYAQAQVAQAEKDRTTIFTYKGRLVSYTDDRGQQYSGYIKSAAAFLKPVAGICDQCLSCRFIVEVQNLGQTS